jgi:hypothetical protein
VSDRTTQSALLFVGRDPASLDNPCCTRAVFEIRSESRASLELTALRGETRA